MASAIQTTSKLTIASDISTIRHPTDIEGTQYYYGVLNGALYRVDAGYINPREIIADGTMTEPLAEDFSKLLPEVYWTNYPHRVWYYNSMIDDVYDFIYRASLDDRIEKFYINDIKQFTIKYSAGPEVRFAIFGKDYYMVVRDYTDGCSMCLHQAHKNGFNIIGADTKQVMDNHNESKHITEKRYKNLLKFAIEIPPPMDARQIKLMMTWPMRIVQRLYDVQIVCVECDVQHD